MEKQIQKKQPQKVSITMQDGKPFNIPPEGSLGLLALGYKGLIAWRQVRRKYQKLRKEKMEKEGKSKESEVVSPLSEVKSPDIKNDK